jgi:soluble lytic murein transglycosylase
MMPRFVLHFILIALGAGLPPLAHADVDSGEQNRRTWQAAQSAIKSGDLRRYRQLRGELDGYVLSGYLDYEYLKDRIPDTPKETLHAYINNNLDSPLSSQLRLKWLQYLVRQQDWDTFLQEYREVDESSELNCRRLDHLLRTNQEQFALLAEVEYLWLTGNRLPAACDAVFNAWRKAGRMTSQLVWDRIGLAMERRNLSLVQELKTYLDHGDRVWVDRWLAMYRNPARELREMRYPVETPVARMVVRYGVVRLGFTDPAQAMQEWSRLKEKYEFFGEDDNYVLRWVGILAAQQHLPGAVEWLSAVSASSNDESLRQWRVRAALRAGQWQTGLRFISALSEEEQKDSEWMYWKARLLEKTGDKKAAWPIFSELATERSYYGFLAADHVGRDYSMQHVSIDASPEEVSAMLARPGIQMAQELFIMGEVIAARRQWAWTTRAMGSRDLQVAAVLARHWGWYDRAILTVGKSDQLDDLELRFPILYRDMVEDSAQKSDIDPSWVYGVLRQESAFVTDARSGAGALGLMQLMPQTGRQTGRRLNLNIHSNSAILKVENNLRLGAGYLKNVLDANNGHQVLATAAYNAGPNRVKEWLPDAEGLDADTWVESIPFNETRNYVKNVLGYTMVYAYRLGNTRLRLQDRMLPIRPLDDTSSSP